MKKEELKSGDVVWRIVDQHSPNDIKAMPYKFLSADCHKNDCGVFELLRTKAEADEMKVKRSRNIFIPCDTVEVIPNACVFATKKLAIIDQMYYHQHMLRVLTTMLATSINLATEDTDEDTE